MMIMPIMKKAMAMMLKLIIFDNGDIGDNDGSDDNANDEDADKDDTTGRDANEWSMRTMIKMSMPYSVENRGAGYNSNADNDALITMTFIDDNVDCEDNGNYNDNSRLWS